MSATTRTRRKPKRLATFKAAGPYANVSPRTIRRWGDDGLLTVYRVGPKLTMIDLDELDELIQPRAAARDAG